MNMDRLTALQVFRQAVELGSFAAAARRLGLSPAAISKNIGELEAHLGVRLLNRTTRRMSTTEAGRLYYEQISRLLDDLEIADQALAPLQQKPKGLLRVSAPLTLTLLTPLSQAMPRFLQSYPEITLDLRLDDRRVNLVEEGYDLAIRASAHLEDSRLVARKLMRTPHIVCAAPAYLEARGRPEAPDDLRRHDCIQFMLAEHADAWRFSKGGKRAQIPISGRYKVTSSLAIREALRAGFGIGLIPQIYVQRDLEEGRLCQLLADWSSSELQVFAVYPSRRQLLPKVRAFLDFLAEVL